MPIIRMVSCATVRFYLYLLVWYHMIPYKYMTKEFYSTTEAANIFRVSRKTILMWIENEKIKADKVGRNYIIPHSSIVEKIGKTLGTERKEEIEKTIDKAMEDFEQTLRRLGKE